MYRIIDSRGSGKTSRLMLLAKEQDAVLACSNPYAMQQKALAYGISGIEFISYEDLINKKYYGSNIMIDELENFVKYQLSGKLVGYTISNED